MIDVIFLGRGGQGAFTSSRILGIAASLYEKKHGLSFPSFGPERRGAPVFAFTKISEEPIRNRTQSNKADYFVVLDESLYNEGLLERLKEGGKLILNTGSPNSYEDPRIITYDANPVATLYLGKPIANTAMLAAFVSYTQIVSIDSLQKAIKYDLPNKIAERNEKLIIHIEECFEKERVDNLYKGFSIKENQNSRSNVADHASYDNAYSRMKHVNDQILQTNIGGGNHE